MKKQDYLIISTQPPYSGVLPRAAIDMALTSAAFEQNVAVVFRDQAVAQLTNGQDTSVSEMKNIGKMIPALEMYDVQRVCVYAPSLSATGIESDQLLTDVEAIGQDELKAMVRKADHVMVY